MTAAPSSVPMEHRLLKNGLTVSAVALGAWELGGSGPGATADQAVGEIADVLAKKKFKKVPVIDEDGKLIGVVRRATITRCLFDVLFGEESAGE